MMTRHSLDGAAITVSTAEAILRAPCLHQHRAPAAEQRHGVRLLHESRWIARQFIAFDARQRERIVGIVNRSAHQCVDALAHQTGVGPEYQHDRLCGIRLGDEAVDVGGFDGGHDKLVSGARVARRRVESEPFQPTAVLGSRDEIRSEPRADIFGDHFGGAVLGVAQTALAGEALLLARNVVGHAREGLTFNDNFLPVARFDQCIGARRCRNC